MIVPIVIAAGAAVAAWKHHKKTAVGMTPDRKKVFEAALHDDKMPPEKLQTLAASFDTAGLKAEGNELRKRAAILTAPKETLDARKAAFKKAMSSADAAAVKKVADAFHAVGHYQAASKLRNYVKGLVHFTPKAAASVHAGEE